MANSNALIKKDRIVAAVRSEEQAKALSNLGITVVQLDLTDENAVIETVHQQNSTNHSTAGFAKEAMD